MHVSFIIEAVSCSSFSFILSRRNYRLFYRFATVFQIPTNIERDVKKKKKQNRAICSLQATFHANNNILTILFWFGLICFSFSVLLTLRSMDSFFVMDIDGEAFKCMQRKKKRRCFKKIKQINK